MTELSLYKKHEDALKVLMEFVVDIETVGVDVIEDKWANIIFTYWKAKRLLDKERRALRQTPAVECYRCSCNATDSLWLKGLADSVPHLEHLCKECAEVLKKDRQFYAETGEK